MSPTPAERIAALEERSKSHEKRLDDHDKKFDEQGKARRTTAIALVSSIVTPIITGLFGISYLLLK